MTDPDLRKTIQEEGIILTTWRSCCSDARSSARPGPRENKLVRINQTH